MLDPELVEVVIKDAIKRSFRKCLCLTDRCYTTSKGTKTSCFVDNHILSCLSWNTSKITPPAAYNNTYFLYMVKDELMLAKHF